MDKEKIHDMLIDYKRKLIELIANDAGTSEYVAECIFGIEAKSSQEIVAIFSDPAMVDGVKPHVVLGMICVYEELNRREKNDSKEN
jgi:hypothetical protein